MAWNKEEAAQATEHAEKELRATLEDPKATAQALIAWWAKWYNGASGEHPTGHKALGRLLVKISKE